MDRVPDQDLAKVMAWLAEKMRCPLCDHQNNLERLKVLPRHSGRGNDVLVHTNCGKCRTALLFALDIRGGEVFLVGVVTDLTYSDAIKFDGQAPLTTDEVIDWHNFWKNFDGDLVKALA